MTQSRNWCFTLNNYTNDDITKLTNITDDLINGNQWCNYIIFQQEISESQTKHLQGYIELTRSRRMTMIKRRLGMDRIHLEKRMGTQAQAIAYCKKDESRDPDGMIYEKGTPKRSRGRYATNGLDAVIEMINDGNTIKQISTNEPEMIIRHGNGIQQLTEARQEHRRTAPEVMIFYGPTGSGKSSKARELYPDAYEVPWPEGGRWWWLITTTKKL